MGLEYKHIEYILANYDEAKSDYERIAEQVFLSDLNFNNRCIQTVSVPKAYTSDDLKLFKDFISKCFIVFNKVIERYINDAEYRKLFPFSKELEELILLPKQFEVNIPMTRIDFFYNEETKEIGLCEVNTDGTAAMNENRIFNELLSLNTAAKFVLGDNYYTFELIDSWIGEFMALWNEYSGNKPNPTVAIVDFLDRATLNEFTRFKEAFERREINCIICDIRELDYDGIVLSYQGRSIDVIYRRAVTSDIVENIESVNAFIAAVKDDNVCIVGGFKSQIIHHKYSFIVLHMEETNAFLSEEEKAFVKAHVPLTKVLTDESATDENIYENKDMWIIKPFDLYAAKGVYAGVDYSIAEWRDLVEKSMRTDEYLMQRYYKPYRTKNIDFSEEEPQVRDYRNMTGVFCYNEKVSGIYSRLSKSGIIAVGTEKVVATVILKE